MWAVSMVVEKAVMLVVFVDLKMVARKGF